MEWFHDWWQSLGLVGQIMACAAVPMTVVMFLQLILMLIGVGFDGDADGDHGGDAPEADSGVDDGGNDAGVNPDAARVFTIRGIVAFFAIGGWAGLAALSSGVPALWSIQIALLSGAAAMLLASVVIRFALKMQSSGNIDLKNSLSKVADVYITIPPSRSNSGKVTLVLQERFVELEAVTDCTEAIKPNTKVEIIDITEKDCLVVRPVGEESNYENNSIDENNI